MVRFAKTDFKETGVSQIRASQMSVGQVDVAQALGSEIRRAQGATGQVDVVHRGPVLQRVLKLGTGDVTL